MGSTCLDDRRLERRGVVQEYQVRRFGLQGVNVLNARP
jgi:hypothetical protein